MSFFDKLIPAPAGECRPRLARMLENGGTASWFDGKYTMVLCHNRAAHRPMQKLPWPLSLTQPHLMEFSIYEGNLQEAQVGPGQSDFEAIADTFNSARDNPFGKPGAKAIHSQI